MNLEPITEDDSRRGFFFFLDRYWYRASVMGCGFTMISVVSVIREMHIKPTPPLTWWVGMRMRDWWLHNTGRLPQKRLHPKTYAPGSHCHAIYPDAVRPIIRRLVLRYLGPQLDLFGDQLDLFE